MEGKKLKFIQPEEQHTSILKQNFGHDKFKPEQWEIIRAVIYDKRDSFIVAGTGFGKSLIYQFPPVFLNQTAIVVSPLISLMEDQVMALKRKGIKACLMGSVQRERKIKMKDFQIVYLTPEFFDTKAGLTKLKALKSNVSLVAIDECHCITQWGPDFRPTFRKLSQFKTLFPNVPIVCLTATATAFCQQDICYSMHLENPLVIRTDLDRPNLEFLVSKRGNSFIEDVKSYLTHITSGAVIIYVLKRIETEQYSQALNREGFAAQPYHAGICDQKRRKVVEDFSEGTLRFVVATIAFGMGIDRPDVRAVIHYGCPKNIESYYQEAGRAGRDGKPAKCFLFWDEKDFKFHRFFLSQTQVAGHRDHGEKLLSEVKNFLLSMSCRRMGILSHFDIECPQLPIRESCCDDCTRKLREIVPLCWVYKGISKKGLLDISDDARDLLSLVEAYDGKCEERNFMKFFTGEMPVKSDKNHPLAFFAKGKPKKQAWWDELFQILLTRKMMKKYIEVQRIPVPRAGDPNDEVDVEVEMIIRRDDYLKITRKGRKFLRHKGKMMEEEPRDEILQFVPKSDKEYFIENGEIKWKPRVLPVPNKKKIREKKTENDRELFKFSDNSPQKREPQIEDIHQPTISVKEEPIFNEGAGCSHWSEPVKKVKSEDAVNFIEINDDEDDEHLENIMEIHNRTRRSIDVELNDLLLFIGSKETQNVCEGETLSQDVVAHDTQEVVEVQPGETQEFEKQVEAQEQQSSHRLSQAETAPSRYDLIEGCSLHFALKRLGTALDEEPEPSKISRLSEEISTQ